MNKTSRKIDLLLAFVLNFVFLVFFVCFHELIQESNDDLAISFLLEGAYGQRSEYVVYQNILWARFIVFLNQLVPQIKWYMVVMFMMIFINFTCIAYTFYRILGRRMGMLINSILLLFCGYHTYVLFQYSRIAAVVTAGGLILMFFALEYAISKKEKWVCILLGGFLALWGSMIRFPMFAVAVVLTGGAIGFYKVWKIFREKKGGWIKQIITYVAVFGTVGVLSLGLYIYDSMQYSKNEYWANFVEYNDVRTELWDYGFPDFHANYDLYQSLGITDRDYVFYWHWNMDAEMLNMEVLNTLAEAKTEREFVISSFLEAFPKIFEKHSVYVLFWVLAILAICLKRKNIYFGLYGFLGVMFFEAVFYHMGRCGWPRVDCGMWMAALLGLAYGMSEDLAKLRDIAWKWVAAGLSIALVLNTCSMSQTTHEMSGAVGSTKALYQEISKDKEHLYVVLSLAPSVYYAYDYWEPCEVGELSNVYNAFGWEQMITVKDDILREYGIENIYRDSIDNDKVYFVTGELTDMLQTYVIENYDGRAYIQYEKDIYGTPIWSIKTSE